MKKILRVTITLAVIVGVAVGVYLRFRTVPVSAASAVQTATVQVGTLSATINAAGNIQAHQTADLTFGQSGTVKQINVKVGDRVKAGAVLAELNTTDLSLSLRTAEVSYKTAQTQFAQTKDPSTVQDIANARAKVASAQAAYDKVAAGASESDLATARAQLASAQATYDAAVKSSNAPDSSLASTTASFEKARIAVQAAQSAYDGIAWRGDVAATSQAQTLQSATIDYNTAKAAYEAALATAGVDAKSKLASAASSLQSARANLESLQTQVSEADLAASKATLIQAQNDLDELLAGPDANSLDIAQNQVEQAQISLEQARLKLQQAQIVAPFDGTITAINLKVGQSSGSSTIQLADLDHLEIVVNMSEVDVNRAKVGQAAEITLDAVVDMTLNGTVNLIAPAGVQSSGVVNYPITVGLNTPTTEVKTGMTANLDIIVDQRTNVLVVPNRAVKTQNRQKVVTVLFEGQQIPTPVQTGLSNDSYTEIISGLQEGDVVVVSGTTTSTTGTGGMGGIGGIGVPGAGGAGGPPPGM